MRRGGRLRSVRGSGGGGRRGLGVPAAYTDLESVLADPDIDAVEILTPTNLHHDHVLAAVAAGKHVSCQKPLANSVTEARAMAAAADEAGTILRVSECYRHYPPLELAKRLIAEGAIGQPSSLRLRTVVGQTDAAFQGGLTADGYTWRMTSQSPGGHLFDDVIHKYAVALWLFDQDIVSVQAVVRRRDFFFEPCAAIFEYEDPGILGTMDISYAPQMWLRSRYYGADEFFEVQGDEGFLWVTRCTGEMLDLPAVVLYDGKHGQETTTSFPTVEADWGEGFKRASRQFVDTLVDGAPAGDERGRGHQGPAAVFRRVPGGQLAPAGRSEDHLRSGRPRGMAPVTARTGPPAPGRRPGREGHPHAASQRERRG